MKFHVLPGDAYVETFRKTEIEGDAIVCREALVVGPVDAETLFEFWEQRARFILAEYGRDEIEYHEHVADELAKLSDLPEETEINLWFENELFCSVNMWFCLDLLKETGAEVYRVEPLVKENFWEGFGDLNADEFKTCFAARKKFSADDIHLGSDLWQEITDGGETDFGHIFPEFKKRAGVYGFGDSQVKSILDTISGS